MNGYQHAYNPPSLYSCPALYRHTNKRPLTFNLVAVYRSTRSKKGFDQSGVYRMVRQKESQLVSDIKSPIRRRMKVPTGNRRLRQSLSLFMSTRTEDC